MVNIGHMWNPPADPNGIGWVIRFSYFWLSISCKIEKIPSHFQSHSSATSPDMILSLVSQIFWSFALISIYCEFGERVSIRFDRSYRAICQFKWYAFPMELKKSLLTVLIVAQQPYELRSFATCSCAREPLKNVSTSDRLSHSRDTSNWIFLYALYCLGDQRRIHLLYDASWGGVSSFFGPR